ncbi:TPA: hypothetical protein ACPTOS_003911 [Escherichia coli]
MQFNEIPLSPDNQQFRVLLGNTTYTLRIIWRDAAGWIMDVMDMRPPSPRLPLAIPLRICTGRRCRISTRSA